MDVGLERPGFPRTRVKALARGRPGSGAESLGTVDTWHSVLNGDMLASWRECDSVMRCQHEHGLQQLASSEPGDTRGREMTWVDRERGNLGAASQEAEEACVLCCRLRVEQARGGQGLERGSKPGF